jgi:hypothetical protein
MTSLALLHIVLIAETALTVAHRWSDEKINEKYKRSRVHSLAQATFKRRPSFTGT